MLKKIKSNIIKKSIKKNITKKEASSKRKEK